MTTVSEKIYVVYRPPDDPELSYRSGFMAEEEYLAWWLASNLTETPEETLKQQGFFCIGYTIDPNQKPNMGTIKLEGQPEQELHPQAYEEIEVDEDGHFTIERNGIKFKTGTSGPDVKLIPGTTVRVPVIVIEEMVTKAKEAALKDMQPSPYSDKSQKGNPQPTVGGKPCEQWDGTGWQDPGVYHTIYDHPDGVRVTFVTEKGLIIPVKNHAMSCDKQEDGSYLFTSRATLNPEEEAK